MKKIDRLIVVDDHHDSRMLLAENIQLMLGLEQEQVREFASAPTIDDLRSAIKDAVTALLICDRNLTKNGVEGDEITRFAKQDLKIDHVVLHTGSFLEQAMIDRLASLGILYFSKGREDKLFEWIKSLQT